MIITSNDKFKLRFAEKKDVMLILGFIKELAIYEHLLDEVVATEEGLCESLFVNKAAEVIIGEYEGKPIGFALFFHNFSTFLGKPGLYLEDIYIQPSFRGLGLGKIMLSFIGKLAKERQCGRVEWWCLDWNKSSIEFYESLGAQRMKDWTVFRVSGDDLDNLAKEA